MNLEHPEHGVAVPAGTTDVLDAEVPDMTAEHLDIDLKVADRCDTGSCGAQAFVVTLHSGFPVLHCAHHYGEHLKKTPDLVNHLVIDARPEINTSASMSANAV